MIEPKGPSGAKVALVTGASRGLGHELCLFLAARGYALVITARSAPELARARLEFEAKGARVSALPGDVAEAGHRKALVEAARAFGRLDVLVNNASELGPSPLRPLAQARPEDLRRVLEVNLVAPLALVQEALPLLQHSRGLVIDISSDAAVGAYPGWGLYGSSKAALDLLTKTLAGELKEAGVAAVSVDPGDMRTKMHQDAYPGQDISDRPLPAVAMPFFAWLLSQEPLKVTGVRFQAQGSLWEVPA